MNAIANFFGKIHEKMHKISAVGRNFGSNVFGFAVSVLFQIVAVPVLLTCWGSELYGTWIMASTVPIYIATCDIGLSTAATSAMIEKLTADDRVGVNAIFLTTLFGLTGVAVTLSASAIVLIQGALMPGLALNGEGTDLKAVVSILILYGCVSLLGTSIQAGFRALNLYATGTSLLTVTTLLENGATLCIALAGGSLAHAALALVTIRSLSSLGQGVLLFRLVPWLRFKVSGFSLPVLKVLLRPALAAAAMPVALAIYLQGAPLVIGLTISPAIVAQFTVVRTLSRFPIQILSLFNHAILPLAARAYFSGDTPSIEKFVGITIVSSAVVALGATLFLCMFGSEVVHSWTNSRIVPEPVLLYSLVAVMFLNVFWHPLSNILMSVNRASTYAPTFMGLTLVALLVEFGVLTVFGLWAIAVPLIALELIMLVVVALGIRHVLFRNRALDAILRDLWRASVHAIEENLLNFWRRL